MPAYTVWLRDSRDRPIQLRPIRCKHADVSARASQVLAAANPKVTAAEVRLGLKRVLRVDRASAAAGAAHRH